MKLSSNELEFGVVNGNTLRFSFVQGWALVSIEFGDEVNIDQFEAFIEGRRYVLHIGSDVAGNDHRITSCDGMICFMQKHHHGVDTTSLTVPFGVCVKAFSDWARWLKRPAEPEIDYHLAGHLNYSNGCIELATKESRYKEFRYSINAVDSISKLQRIVDGHEDKIYCGAGLSKAYYFYIESKGGWLLVVCSYETTNGVESGGSGFAVPLDSAKTGLQSLMAALET